jgi:uncharacterized protein (TIGR00369 family)
MPDEEHFRKLERMYAKAPINEYFKPTLRISEGEAHLEMEIRSDFFHTAGSLHGSVYFKALDDSAFFAVNSLVDDCFVLTTSFTTHITRPVTEGTITAVGKVVSQSKRLFVAEARMWDSNQKLIASGSGTFLRSNVALSPDIGYS